MTDIEEISGNGVTAKVDGISVAAGNAKLMKKLGISIYGLPSVWERLSIWQLTVNMQDTFLFLILIKPHAKEAIAELKACRC